MGMKLQTKKKERKAQEKRFFSRCELVDDCVCLHVVSWVAHVMTLGPRRPVLSWMLEIFRAMAMRGPSTTCSEEHITEPF